MGSIVNNKLTTGFKDIADNAINRCEHLEGVMIFQKYEIREGPDIIDECKGYGRGKYTKYKK